MAPSMQHPLYPILEVEYDYEHRAHVLTDTDAKVALVHLRPRTYRYAHQWDEPYAPYIVDDLALFWSSCTTPINVLVALVVEDFCFNL